MNKQFPVATKENYFPLFSRRKEDEGEEEEEVEETGKEETTEAHMMKMKMKKTRG